MIRLLTGTIALLSPDSLVVDVRGVGYEVFVPLSELRSLQADQTLTLHIYTHVREDTLQLYGFADDTQRKLFLQLLEVSGVGPRSALAVLDKGAANVITAIQNSDIPFFKSVPRLGKKTAQKIIVELQSKVGTLQELNLGAATPVSRDVREALLTMGYNETAVDEVLTQLEPEWDVKQALKWALQRIGK